MRELLTRIFNTRLLLTVLVVLIGLAAILGFGSQFFYLLETVEEQEVGVQFQGGRITGVVPAGVYSAVGYRVQIVRVSTQAIPFTVTDEEIITRDKQRIGLTASGDIFRPRSPAVLQDNWFQYRGIYTDDVLATDRVEDLARQSMKVCVGDRNFDDNVVGTARDELRVCIDQELNDLAGSFGLEIRNLVVPEIILSPEVQVALDAIVQSRLSTEKAAQDQLKAQAEALAEQARQEGEIRVEQSRLQEQTRQQTLLAELERQRLAAQLNVIEATRANSLAQIETDRQVLEAEKANELLGAELDLDINEALALAAEAKAQADLAFQTVLASLYAANPSYVQLLIAQANASALNATDKIIFTQDGMTPTLVLPGPGIVPTVETNPGATSSAPAETTP